LGKEWLIQRMVRETATQVNPIVLCVFNRFKTQPI
jgi:hypothetical protein